jgi:low temperature requirement protein LtrA
MLRDRSDGHAPVTNLELFFDLVYAFAITQLSHSLLHHLTLGGLVQTALLFLAVWWAWINTVWVTNWAEPERAPVRLMLIAGMLLSLVMAIALPGAFADYGRAFAISYVVLQIGRTLAMIGVFAHANHPGARNMARIAVWFSVSAVPWIGGAMSDPSQRAWWWAAALAINYTAPLAFFYVPGLGRSRIEDWTISGGHIAERAGGFIIVALGEGIVVTGSTVAEGRLGNEAWPPFLLAFAGSVLMWWLYFDRGAGRASDKIEHHEQPGRMARSAYTYLHMPIVGAIVVSAVADALVLERSGLPASQVLVLAEGGGMALYLAGLGAFKLFASPNGNFPLSHIGGLVMTAALVAAALIAPMNALTFYAEADAVLLIVAAWEWRSYNGGWRRERLAR